MSKFGAIDKVIVVVPVQFAVVSLCIFCLTTPSTQIAFGAEVKENIVFTPFTIPVATWKPYVPVSTDKVPSPPDVFTNPFVSKLGNFVASIFIIVSL